MEAFYQEAHDLIAEMGKDLSSLGEERDPTIFHRLYRCAHTIKSSSGSVGYNELHEMTQALEQIFKAASEGRYEINDDAISLFSASVDACRRLLHERKEATGYKGLLERLNSLIHP
jgi:two-component system chemotaxis sensor kinase CheA